MGNVRFTTVNSEYDFPLVSFRLGTFAWERSLGIFRFGTLAWDLSRENCRLEHVASEISLGFLRVEYFRFDSFDLGNVRLGQAG